MAAETSSLFEVSSVEFDVVHCFPSKNFENQKNIEKRRSDAQIGVSVTVFAVAAGADLSKKLLCLALRHYDLASTTVTGLWQKLKSENRIFLPDKLHLMLIL